MYLITPINGKCNVKSPDTADAIFCGGLLEISRFRLLKFYDLSNRLQNQHPMLPRLGGDRTF